jgi:hypothetical protein
VHRCRRCQWLGQFYAGHERSYPLCNDPLAKPPPQSSRACVMPCKLFCNGVNNSITHHSNPIAETLAHHRPIAHFFPLKTFGFHCHTSGNGSFNLATRLTGWTTHFAPSQSFACSSFSACEGVIVLPPVSASLTREYRQRNLARILDSQIVRLIRSRNLLPDRAQISFNRIQPTLQVSSPVVWRCSMTTRGLTVYGFLLALVTVSANVSAESMSAHVADANTPHLHAAPFHLRVAVQRQ